MMIDPEIMTFITQSTECRRAEKDTNPMDIPASAFGALTPSVAISVAIGILPSRNTCTSMCIAHAVARLCGEFIFTDRR
jgi:hypothetical protein